MNLARTLLSGRTRFPNAMAIHHAGHHLTYERLFHDVERIAAHLVGQGIAPAQRAAVHIGHPLSHWIVTLALMRVGAVSVSLTDRFEAEVAALPDLAAVILGRAEKRPYPTRLRQIRIDADWLSRAPEIGAPLPSEAEAAATVGRICFTSGTSGGPKAVELTSPLLHARLAATAQRSRIQTRSVLWCGLGPDVAYGFTAPLAAWLEGAAVVFSSGGGGAYAAFVAQHVNLLIASPAAMTALLRDAASGTHPPLAATVIVAGGRLSAALRDALRDRLCSEILVAYGSSEAGGVSLGDARGLDTHPGRVGAVFADVEASVVDEAGRPLPAGAPGRLRVRTDSSVARYLDDAAATADSFRDGWFESGDIASLTADGTLNVLSRPANSLNIGGVKVSAEEIDAVAGACDGVEDACAVVLPPDDRLALIIVGRPGSAEALAAEIRSELPSLPRFSLIAVPAIPRGSMGKVNRGLLGGQIAAAIATPSSGPFAGGVDFIGRF